MKQSKTRAAQKPSAQKSRGRMQHETKSSRSPSIPISRPLPFAGCAASRDRFAGLESMVDQERYCADILVQIASVQEALRGVSRLLMRNHLEHCATMAIRDGGDSASAMYDELLDLVYRHAR